MNHRNPAIKRIFADVKELQKHPSNRYHAAPTEDNMFEWHFTIRGPPDTAFEGGIYHGRIILPAEYPFKPPNIVFLTPNGRFEVGTKICLSISAYHEETWQPAWGVRTMLEAIISFFPSEGNGAIGALDWKPEERKKLAQESHKFHCPVCGKVKDLLSTTITNDQPDSIIQQQIAEIHMTLPSQSGKVLKQNPVAAGLSQEDDAFNNQLLQGECLGVSSLAHPEMAQACAIASMEENADAEDTLDSIMETDITMGGGGNGTPHTPPIGTSYVRKEGASVPLITPVKEKDHDEKNTSDMMTSAASKCGCFHDKQCVIHDTDLMLAPPTTPPRNPATIISPLHSSTPQSELRRRIPATTGSSPPHTPITTNSATTDHNNNTFATDTPYATPHTAPSTPDTIMTDAAPQPVQAPAGIQIHAPAAAAPPAGIVHGRQGQRGAAAAAGNAAEVAQLEEGGMQMIDALMIVLIVRILYILYGIFMRNYLLHYPSSSS